MGVNLPAMFVKAMIGQDWSEMKNDITESATYKNERICMDNWQEGYITTKEFSKILEDSSISFIHDKNDPIPEMLFHLDFKKKRFMRVFMR